jgi:hypothetical protein
MNLITYTTLCYSLLACNQSNWNKCVEDFGPHMKSENIEPDKEHGVTIQLEGESGKTMTFSVYPDEARKIANLLNQCADEKSSKTHKVPLSI